MECGPDQCPIMAFSDLTPAEQRVQRKRWAQKLYEQNFTMEQIAKQLGVSHPTIVRDLKEFVHHEQTSSRVSKRGRTGEGRPKGSKSAPKRHYRENEIITLVDEGKSYAEIAKHTEIGKRQIRHVVEREMTRREAKAEVKPEIDRSALSLSAQQRLDAAVNQEKRRLGSEFADLVAKQVRENLEVMLKHYNDKHDHYQKVINVRRGLIKKADFNRIRFALHPDTYKGISDDERNALCQKWEELRSIILSEADYPTVGPGLPRTLKELDEQRQKYQEERRAARAAKKERA